MPVSPEPISQRLPQQKKNPARLSSSDEDDEELPIPKSHAHLEVHIKREDAPSRAAPDEAAVPREPQAPDRSAAGGGRSHTANVRGGKLVHRKGRLVSESSSEGGDDSSSTTVVASNSLGHGRSGMATPTTTQNMKEEHTVKGGSKGTENPPLRPQQPQKVGATGDRVSKLVQAAPLAVPSGSKPAAGVAANTTKLRLVDIDFTGGRAKSAASKQPLAKPAQRKPVPSIPVKKPDLSVPKPQASLKVTSRQSSGSLLMVSGVIDKATYRNHDSSNSPTKPMPVANGRKDDGASHAHKDAILSTKFPQLKRKMLSEQLEAEAPAAKVKKLLS